jgi:hypothetical protein
MRPDFSCMPRATVPLGSKKDPEFEGHVEPWQSLAFVETCTRQIVNAKPALANDFVDLVKPHLAPVVLFARAARKESAVVDREHKSVEDLLVPEIKRNVDEDSARRNRHWDRDPERPYFAFFAATLVTAIFFGPELLFLPLAFDGPTPK